MALKGFSLAEVNKFAGSLKQQGIPHNTNISVGKAKEILKHGEVHGKKLTKKQRGFMGARAAGLPIKKK